MSGTIVDLPIMVCRACKTTYLIDERMYEEPERCPKCGWKPAEADPDGPALAGYLPAGF